jgi:shikimate dehydrogenase
MRRLGPVEAIGADTVATAIAEADWLVNTTSVGMRGGPPGSPAPDGVLPASGAVIDLVYRPRPTPLLAAAAAAGLETQDGVAMLVHQGAASFTAWTGRQAPLAAMFEAVERSLSDATA